MHILILILVLVHSIPSDSKKINGFAVYTDISGLRIANAPYFCYINFTEDHTGLSPIQPESNWTVVQIRIPNWANGIQLTGVPDKPTIDYNVGALYTTIEKYTIVQRTGLMNIFQFWVTWYGKPWSLFVGWVTNLNNSHHTDSSPCITLYKPAQFWMIHI